ncbi:phosphoribosyltransferase family protein [Nocardia vaccinii]|uniref:phosphoribosyltransferase family protein n=1 Tax=Nocardia vaccinii TaxID=1822 RepID=UPI00082A691E|nr:phosphoribosyltransferase family protein [Nocardia vaccinii]
MSPFTDRKDAGRQLATLLPAFRGSDVVVLAPPGGGLRVACEMAATLRVLVDVILVGALSVARRPGLTYGILGEDHTLIVDTAAIARGAIGPAERARAEQTQDAVLHCKALAYRGHRLRVDLRDRTVLVTDDCLADTTTLRDACRITRLLGAIRTVVAVPVGSRQSMTALIPYTDKIVCPNPTPQTPDPDQWYPYPDDITSSGLVALLDSGSDR